MSMPSAVQKPYSCYLCISEAQTLADSESQHLASGGQGMVPNPAGSTTAPKKGRRIIPTLIPVSEPSKGQGTGAADPQIRGPTCMEGSKPNDMPGAAETVQKGAEGVKSTQPPPGLSLGQIAALAGKSARKY